MGLCPVRPADMLSAGPVLSGLQIRGAHRLQVHVPNSTLFQRSPRKRKESIDAHHTKNRDCDMIFGFLKQRRRRNITAKPFPAAWRSIITRNVPIFQRLPRADQIELLGNVQVFLAEKRFEGCGGLEITDEIRVTIATQACLLLLHRTTDYYPHLTSILVYRSSYLAHEVRPVETHVWSEGDEPRLGHTGRRLGSLVLAWDDVRRSTANSSDGRNLVLHEFAHQLDFEDYTTDGAPALATKAEYQSWARVMNREFAALRAAAEAGMPTVLDIYGAENPAEFFAVVTEAFFEGPRALRARHPELYAEFARFFRQDPVQYFAESPGCD
jgi:Mlc titration factor MtfA (ptsG expression regulator)